jgi:hypothetical protein
MYQLLWFCLAAYGLTQMLTYGSIFDRIRPSTGLLGALFRCPMCMGFWVGVFLFGVNYNTELFTFEYTIANLLICGCVSSAVSYALCSVFGDNGIQIGGNG